MYSYSNARKVTRQLLENLEDGLYDKDRMIQDLLGWLSEDEVAAFARSNEYIVDSEEDEDDE